MPLPYAILFENLDTATAPAHEIVITDQLNGGALDLTTFSLGPIRFGDTLIVPSAGLSQYATDVDLRPANNLIVRINAGLDVATGLATWHFVSLDPTTMLPPDDSQIGFLPPNVTPPAGEGAVLFTVKPKPDLPTGLEIRNEATIVFDTNDPINTPEWFNTLDRTKPDSSILLLSATQPSPTFTVQWSGIDVGSGIQDYTIFVSENGGPFTAELTNTTDTSATFTGQVGKTYAFYSVARDQTGNLEDAPTVPDATTQVVGADQCPNDPNKTEPGVCGCGVSDVDSDGDGVLDCLDGCPSDPAKTAPGVCGCGVPDTDSDSDGIPDCQDACPADPNKTAAGVCGCGVPDTDSDGDGTPDCRDACPADPNKTAAGVCGCSVADTDSDGDGVANCRDNCPTVANPDQKDSNGDGKGDACTEVCGNCRDDDGDKLIDLRDPDCPASALTIEKGVLALKPDPQEDKITLQGTFAGAANSINPPVEGVTVSLIDADGLITCLNMPPGAGWKTSKGPKWVFKDKKDGSLGDPEADE